MSITRLADMSMLQAYDVSIGRTRSPPPVSCLAHRSTLTRGSSCMRPLAVGVHVYVAASLNSLSNSCLTIDG